MTKGLAQASGLAAKPAVGRVNFLKQTLVQVPATAARTAFRLYGAVSARPRTTVYEFSVSCNMNSTPKLNIKEIKQGAEANRAEWVCGIVSYFRGTHSKRLLKGKR